jgi:hypothetical protein
MSVILQVHLRLCPGLAGLGSGSEMLGSEENDLSQAWHRPFWAQGIGLPGHGPNLALRMCRCISGHVYPGRGCSVGHAALQGCLPRA